MKLKFKKLKKLSDEKKKAGHQFDGPVSGLSSDHLNDEGEIDPIPTKLNRLYRKRVYSSREPGPKISGIPSKN